MADNDAVKRFLEKGGKIYIMDGWARGSASAKGKKPVVKKDEPKPEQRVVKDREIPLRRMFEPGDKVRLPRFDIEKTVVGRVTGVSDDRCRILKVRLNNGTLVLAERKWTKRMRS